MDCEYHGPTAKLILITEDSDKDLFKTNEIKHMNYINSISPSKSNLSFLTSTDLSLLLKVLMTHAIKVL